MYSKRYEPSVDILVTRMCLGACIAIVYTQDIFSSDDGKGVNVQKIQHSEPVYYSCYIGGSIVVTMAMNTLLLLMCRRFRHYHNVILIIILIDY